MSGRMEQRRRAKHVGIVKLADAGALAEALGWIAEILPYCEAWAEGLKLRHDPKVPASFIARATLEGQIERAQKILKRHGYVEITPSVKRIGEHG
jgi:hypothetical protein